MGFRGTRLQRSLKKNDQLLSESRLALAGFHQAVPVAGLAGRVLGRDSSVCAHRLDRTDRVRCFLLNHSHCRDL